MKIHLVGICGTFMGGVARFAKALGHEVSGSDQNTYPPMSTQLEELDVVLYEGYSANNIPEDVDITIVGNTISRGNPELEHILNNNIAFTSGAQWLNENVLHNKWVIAVSGTHGKTTTSSIITWILEYCGYNPSFLIGGVPANFGVSSRYTDSMFFVIEADEYDTAFSDKRSKFLHYKPRTLIINNLEFDHADIFKDLEAIQTQFHHLLKIVPKDGQVIYNLIEDAVTKTLDKGCWSEQKTFQLGDNSTQLKQSSKEHHPDWKITADNPEASEFTIHSNNQMFKGKWGLIGQHNLNNVITAVAAAHHVGVNVNNALKALPEFQSVARRLEFKAKVKNVSIYDDFAHHPTAITLTLEALRKKVGSQRIVAVLEARSNTMRMGFHKDKLINSLKEADNAFIYLPQSLEWRDQLTETPNLIIAAEFDNLLQDIVSCCGHNTHVLIMSNGGFQGIHKKLETVIMQSS